MAIGSRINGKFGMAARAAALAAALSAAPSAHAITTLKQVQVSNGSQIDLLFDGKVRKNQIRTEFLGDIIQLSIQDVSVYPAKISSVNGGPLTKIFAYQYAPKLVRCRLTVKGKAETYKDRLEVKAGGQILTVRMQGETKVAAKTAAPATASAQARASEPDAEEKALLSHVMAAGAPAVAEKPPVSQQPAPQAQAVAAAPAPAKPAQAEKASPEKASKDSITVSSAAATSVAPRDGAPSTESLPIHLSGDSSAKLGGAKPLPSPLKAFGRLGVVLGIFGIFAFALKRYAQGRADSRLSDPSALMKAGRDGGASASEGGWLSALGQIAKKGLGRRNRMIEVLSTHYLGPKKSIAVVRVAGHVLVLGVSNESINLITQLSSEDAAEQLGGGLDSLELGDLAAPAIAGTTGKGAPSKGAGATAAGGAVFSDVFQAERGKPAFGAPSGGAGVRAQIRNRLEGLKQL